MTTPRLIVGLGNPGKEYQRTRHNAGYLVLEKWADQRGVGWEFEKKFESYSGRLRVGTTDVWFCRPTTFMNASGQAVAKFSAYYRIPMEHLMVVVDDADLPLGTIRMRPNGRSGGHHGLESVEARLGSNQFARLRIGIGRMEATVREIANYVLGQFGGSEWVTMEMVLERAIKQLECWVNDGVLCAMNRYNGRD